MKLYVYNYMTNFADDLDIALTYANSLEEAKEKFAKLYNDTDNISEVQFNEDGVAILTDY